MSGTSFHMWWHTFHFQSISFDTYLFLTHATLPSNKGRIDGRCMALKTKAKRTRSGSIQSCLYNTCSRSSVLTLNSVTSQARRWASIPRSQITVFPSCSAEIAPDVMNDNTHLSAVKCTTSEPGPITISKTSNFTTINGMHLRILDQPMGQRLFKNRTHHWMFVTLCFSCLLDVKEAMKATLPCNARSLHPYIPHKLGDLAFVAPLMFNNWYPHVPTELRSASLAFGVLEWSTLCAKLSKQLPSSSADGEQ